MGMVSDPVVTVFAMAEPEIDPIAADANTLAFAGPPRYLPAAAKARSMKTYPRRWTRETPRTKQT